MEYFISLLSVCISLVAIVLSYLSFKKQQNTQTYSDIDVMYFEILKLGLEYPELRNQQKASKYYTLPKDDAFRIRYETYANVCWNLCEAIYDRQKKLSGALRISSTWIPVILEENRVHQVWFSHNLRLFKKEFQIFVEEVLNSVEIIRINDYHSKEFKSVMEMYGKQFPAEERKSMEQVETLLRRKIYTLFIARHKYIDNIIGFALVLFNNDPDFLFLDYLAIDPMFQRCGFGTIFFNSIVEMQNSSSLGILLELEKPQLATFEQETTKRTDRIQFYLRSGCTLLEGINYKLPNANGEAIPMELAFKPNATIKVLPAETMKSLISNVYDKIHSDIQNRDRIFQDFESTIHDQYFLK
ncbi:MAG TPA: hypothetical protein DDW65_18945 [Firmicutes bacterium]|nr:hypothetical protein [Bacillota bacterium]